MDRHSEALKQELELHRENLALYQQTSDPREASTAARIAELQAQLATLTSTAKP